MILGWSSVSAAYRFFAPVYIYLLPISLGGLPNSNITKCKLPLGCPNCAHTLSSSRMVKMNRRTTNAKKFLIGAALILLSFILFIIEVILYFVLLEQSAWILAAPASYLNDVLASDVVLACLLLICIYSIYAFGVMTTAVIATHIYIYLRRKFSDVLNHNRSSLPSCPRWQSCMMYSVFVHSSTFLSHR